MDKHSGEEESKKTEACDPGYCASKAEIKNAMLSFALAYDDQSPNREEEKAKE